MSVIVIDTPINPQQFLASSFCVACFCYCDPDLETEPDLDIVEMCLQTENEVARSSHSKYIT